MYMDLRWYSTNQQRIAYYPNVTICYIGERYDSFIDGTSLVDMMSEWFNDFAANL